MGIIAEPKCLIDIRYTDCNMLENFSILNELEEELKNFYSKCDYKFTKKKMIFMNNSNDFVEVSNTGIVIINNKVSSIGNFGMNGHNVIGIIRKKLKIDSIRRCGMRIIHSIQPDNDDSYEKIKSKLFKIDDSFVEKLGKIRSSKITLNLNNGGSGSYITFSIYEREPLKFEKDWEPIIDIDTDMYVDLDREFNTDVLGFIGEAIEYDRKKIYNLIREVVGEDGTSEL